jgi:hypothetical protein
VNLLLKALRGLESKASEYRLRKRRRRSLALLAQCKLFDRGWYLQTYPDVRDSNVDPIAHYLESGWREGRDPGPDFSTAAYLKGNSDVAALGINPLLHYIEHGRFEGRGAPHVGAPFRASFSPDKRFGPAAPCASFTAPPLRPVRWARAGRIRAKEELLASIEDVSVAHFGNDRDKLSFENALEQLAWVSGQNPTAPEMLQISGGIGLELRDAWNSGTGILRTRWLPAERPIVIRSIQHHGRGAALVGEGCIADRLDVLDIRPLSPLYPLLFVFTTADGQFLGFRQLTFPALCRGGLYYPELIALARADNPTAAVDLARMDGQLSSRLFSIRTTAAPTVAEVTVTLEAADGSHPLFQAEYRQWLANIMCVSVKAAVEGTGPIQKYLAAAVKLDASTPRRGAATLRLANDMVPSISALVMSSEGCATDDLAGSLIVASSDRNIAIWIRIADGTPAAEFGGYSSALPALLLNGRAGGLPTEALLLAIRMPARRPLDDAELLFPRLPRVEETALDRPSITWLLRPDRWSEPELMHCLEALAEQTSSASATIFIGEPGEVTACVAEQLFGTVRVAPTTREATKLIETSLAGYIGSNIILHDRRTASLLVEALDDDTITVTAPVVSIKKGAKRSLALPDGGTAFAHLLPHAVVPIAEPSRDFWIARAEMVRELYERPTRMMGRHLCSMHVSVSRLSGTKTEPDSKFPARSKQCSSITEALIG